MHLVSKPSSRIAPWARELAVRPICHSALHHRIGAATRIGHRNSEPQPQQPRTLALVVAKGHRNRRGMPAHSPCPPEKAVGPDMAVFSSAYLSFSRARAQTPPKRPVLGGQIRRIGPQTGMHGWPVPSPHTKICLKAPAFGLLRWPVRLLFLGVAAPPSLVPSAMRAQCGWEHVRHIVHAIPAGQNAFL